MRENDADTAVHIFGAVAGEQEDSGYAAEAGGRYKCRDAGCHGNEQWGKSKHSLGHAWLKLELV